METIIPQASQKDKSWPKFLAIAAIILLSASGAFAGGILVSRNGAGDSSNKDLPIMERSVRVATSTIAGKATTTNIEGATETKPQTAAKSLGEPVGETVIASKNGSKYHFPWCSGAKRIGEKTKVTFASAAEARKAGYEPAANCKGLK